MLAGIAATTVAEHFMLPDYHIKVIIELIFPPPLQKILDKTLPMDLDTITKGIVYELLARSDDYFN